MFLLIFSLFSILQIIVYFIINKTKAPIPLVLILAIILGFYFIFLPNILIPKPIDDGIPRCGMPVVINVISVWVMGLLFSISTHFFYIFILKNIFFYNKK